MVNIIVPIVVGAGGFYLWRKQRQKRQLQFIENYQFPSMLLERVKKKHDYLSDDDLQKVAEAMRDYFYICNLAKGKMVAMPSEIVDVLWHEFILFTRAYEKFCDQALGRFLHHTPTEAMPQKSQATEGIKRAWRLACAKANINPKKPNKLPLLFAIDTLLNIENGFKYRLDCRHTPYQSSSQDGKSGCAGYCATDIGCASGCVGASGNSADGGFFGGDSDSGGFFGGGDSSCSSGCSGGCGGD